MTKKAIQKFFEVLDRNLGMPLTCLLTGGSAANLQGVSRTTQDIDFEIRVKKAPGQRFWNRLKKALIQARAETGIEAEYSTDIDRWGSIALPRPRARGRAWNTIGRIRIYLQDPGEWAIGKLSRALATDISDIETVFRNNKPELTPVLRCWGRALGQSPPSSSLDLFRRQVYDFLETKGSKIWGRSFNAETAKAGLLSWAQRSQGATQRRVAKKRKRT